jgi:hypothetical protein
MEYKIALEVMKHPELGDIPKLFIYYYGGEFDGMREYYGRPDKSPETKIREGYVEKQNIASRIARAVTEPVIEKTVVIDNVEYKLVENKLSLWQRFLNFIK